jgi:phosphate transport system protein
MSGNHTVKSYDADLEGIDAVVKEMMDKTAEQITRACEAVATGDQAMAGEVESADRAINALEQELQEICVKILALREPKGRDLRKVVCATRIAVDIERVADYAVNVAKRVPALNSSLSRDLVSEILKMAGNIKEMISGLSEAYESSDSRKALDMWRKDDQVDEIFSKILSHTLPQMECGNREKRLEIYTLALFVVKAIERMGDHLTNVAEHIYYSVEGVQLYSAVDKRPSL